MSRALLLVVIGWLAVPTTSVAAPRSAVPFIEDNYPRALAQARREGKPLFAEAWAPWCHSCLSLRAYVFTDARLRPWAHRFVWLAVDTEKAKNAAFGARYPLEAWPSLYVIDPNTETAVRTWRGALTVEELLAWLQDASSATPTGHQVARGREVEANVVKLRRDDQHETCVTAAREAMTGLHPGTSRLNVALEGLLCAQKLGRTEARAPFVAELERIVGDATFPVLADDRSAAYEALVDDAEGDRDRARSIAERWAKFLEAEAAKAPTAAGRAVFDAHRVGAYLALGEPARAVPMLQQSARDFPRDYNPPARLARVYLTMGRLDEARVMIRRALRLAYGPRRQRLQALQAEIEAARSQLLPGGDTGNP